jgi:DmsE family decaheme c-type cytochrome
MLGAILIPVLASIISMPAAAQDKRTSNAAEARFTTEGAERCLRCHAGERMTVMAETIHGNSDNPHTPFARQGCEACHGPGSLHVSRARGGIGFPALIVFDERDTVERQTGVCIACHADDMGDLEGMEWTGSMHDTEDVTCISCHEMHRIGNPLREQKQQREACGACHAEQIENHRQFADKGIVFDKLTCFDCHDVHQLIHEP